jgi:hypothetical protein
MACARRAWASRRRRAAAAQSVLVWVLLAASHASTMDADDSPAKWSTAIIGTRRTLQSRLPPASIYVQGLSTCHAEANGRYLLSPVQLGLRPHYVSSAGGGQHIYWSNASVRSSSAWVLDSDASWHNGYIAARKSDAASPPEGAALWLESNNGSRSCWPRDSITAAGNNTCRYASDGVCDDGRFGQAIYCGEGTDAYDCDAREAALTLNRVQNSSQPADNTRGFCAWGMTGQMR